MSVRFTPQMYINHYVLQKGITIADIGVAPVVVISWAPSVIQTFADSTGAQPAPHWPWSKRYRFYTGQVDGQRVSFAQVGLGAPATVTGMEEMIACGAQKFIGLGWAGSLQPYVSIGSFLIPTGCIREEGTSLHYLADATQLAPDAELEHLLSTAAQAAGVPALRGSQWTTDAPYRELCSKIAAYRAQGVLGVDMETSAMYALGRFRNVAVCNLLVVSDEVWREWRSAAWTAEIKAATGQAQQIILKALGCMRA